MPLMTWATHVLQWLVHVFTIRKWFYSDVAPDAIRGISEKEKGDYEDIGVPASRMVMCWWD